MRTKDEPVMTTPHTSQLTSPVEKSSPGRRLTKYNFFTKYNFYTAPGKQLAPTFAPKKLITSRSRISFGTRMSLGRKTSIFFTQSEVPIVELSTPDPHIYFRDKTYIFPLRDEHQSFLNKFYSEKTSGLNFLPTARCSILFNLLCFFYFIIIGLVLLGLTNNIQELNIRYDDTCSQHSICVINFTINTYFQAPVYLYYQLNDFHSNHKFYIDSIQQQQMHGLDISLLDQERFCVNALLNRDMPHPNNSTFYSASGYLIDQNQYANPCGVAAKYIFNDSFEINNPVQDKIIHLNQTNITSQYDIKYKFNRHKQYSFRQWLDMNDQETQNWFGIQTLPQMMKLYARIDENLYHGNYQILIQNNYPSSIYGGTKSFILTTVCEFGTKNTTLAKILLFIGLSYLLIGCYIHVRKVRRKNSKKYQVYDYIQDFNKKQVQIKGSDQSITEPSNVTSIVKIRNQSSVSDKSMIGIGDLSSLPSPAQNSPNKKRQKFHFKKQ